MKLVDIDRLDGSSKVNDLRYAIGRIYSDNHSTTNRSRLVSVSECGNYCYTEEVASEYSKTAPIRYTGLSKQPSWLVWNGIFS
jgi:hypothetical protein